MKYLHGDEEVVTTLRIYSRESGEGRDMMGIMLIILREINDQRERGKRKRERERKRVEVVDRFFLASSCGVKSRYGMSSGNSRYKYN